MGRKDVASAVRKIQQSWEEDLSVRRHVTSNGYTVGPIIEVTVLDLLLCAGALLLRSHEEAFASKVNKGIELLKHVPTDCSDRIGWNRTKHFSDFNDLEYVGTY